MSCVNHFNLTRDDLIKGTVPAEVERDRSYRNNILLKEIKEDVLKRIETVLRDFVEEKIKH